MSTVHHAAHPPPRASRAPRVKIIVAGVLMLAALGVFLGGFYRPAPRIDTRLHEFIGRVMAEEAAKLLATGGGIVLIAPDTAVFPNPSAQARLRGFRDALERAKLPLAATNLFRLDPLRQVRVPPGDYFDLLRRRADGDVIVSFLGPPLLSDEQHARLAGKPVRIVALCPTDLVRQTGLKSLFARNSLHAGIVHRALPAPQEAPDADGRARFNRLYTVVTAENLADNLQDIGGSAR